MLHPPARYTHQQGTPSNRLHPPAGYTRQEATPIDGDTSYTHQNLDPSTAFRGQLPNLSSNKAHSASASAVSKLHCSTADNSNVCPSTSNLLSDGYTSAACITQQVAHVTCAHPPAMDASAASSAAPVLKPILGPIWGPGPH